MKVLRLLADSILTRFGKTTFDASLTRALVTYVPPGQLECTGNMWIYDRSHQKDVVRQERYIPHVK